MALHTFNPVFAVEGRVPTMGTFAVQLPSVAATSGRHHTIVTLSNMLQGDMVVVFDNGGPQSYGAATSAVICTQALAQDGQLLLTFINTASATAYCEKVFAYVTARGA